MVLFRSLVSNNKICINVKAISMIEPIEKIVRVDDKISGLSGWLPRPIVFTNGVFDLLHRGHVVCLEAARNMGASLVVAVNSDKSTRMLRKAPERPFNPEFDRAYLIASLESVTAVVIFDQIEPLNLIGELKPEIYVKGGDYRIEDLKENILMTSWGGRTVVVPFLSGYSTSVLVEKIRSKS